MQEKGQSMSKIKLGDAVKCELTGFEGVVMAKHTHVYYKTTYQVLPIPADDNPAKFPKAEWLPAGMLEVVFRASAQDVDDDEKAEADSAEEGAKQ